MYCFDKAGNLASQGGTASTCPGSALFTSNDASQLTAQTGSTTPWSYDKLGNEKAGGRVAASARTNETWTDYSQLSAITTGGTTYDLVHAGTDNSERTKLGSTWFHHTALGLASTTTNGVDTGFIREPEGTLNSMTTGGKSYYYLTDATGNVLGLVDDAGKRTHTYAYGPTGLPRGTTTEATRSRSATRAPTSTRRGCTRWVPATTTPNSAVSPSQTLPDRKPTPTSMPPATP